MASSSSQSPRQEDPQETAASNGNHYSSPVPRSPSPNAKRSSKSPVKDLEERDERSNRSKSPASRSRSRSRSRSPARKRSISPVRRRSRSHSPRRRRSYSPRRRRSYSPRRRSRSRSPRRSSRYRSRSKSPYNRRRYSSRDRYSRRSPPRHRGRRSPRRRPWTPPADRTNGLGEPGNNLFVAGFNFITTERDLERKFGKFGKVYDCRIVRDKRSGESRGFGFLTLEHDEEADAAIKALDQTEWNGRIVLVEKAKTPTRY